MILLLDAHALIWWFGDDRSLAPSARDAIRSPANEVLVSAATVWEIAIKRASGKLQLPGDLTTGIHAAQFQALPITFEDAEAAAALPTIHRDPFDRILVAQALRVGATIVSRDAGLDAYGVDRLPT